jgi:hypothetical protein
LHFFQKSRQHESGHELAADLACQAMTEDQGFAALLFSSPFQARQYQMFLSKKSS